MDPLSFTASLLAILETATFVGKTAAKFYRNVHNAPQELQWTSSRILQKRAQLCLVLEICQEQKGPNAADESFPVVTECLAPLEAALKDAAECLERLEQISGSQSGLGKRSLGVKWAVRDKKTVSRLLDHLSDVEGSLTILMLVLSVSHSSSSHIALLDLAQKQDRILEQLSQRARGMAGLTFPFQQSHAALPTHAALPWVWRSSPLIEGQPKQGINISLLLNRHWTSLQSTYAISCFLRLPFLLSQYAIAIRAKCHFFSARWPTISHHISFKNIVPSSSRFMIAVAKGNFLLARELVIEGQGSPTDVDERGEPALHKSVRSGSFELVKFLLDSGADANVLDEVCHGSALAVACRRGSIEIARLLLIRGACVHHINDSGTGVLVNVWQRTQIRFPRIEFVKVLVAFSTPPINPGCGQLINPLNCVALVGSAEDVDFLLSLGAETGKGVTFENHPIRYSLWGSNPSTYRRLESFMAPDWVHQADNQGRTPLHHAVLFPGPHVSEIVQSLIRAGADIHARDSDGDLPEDIARLADDRAKDAHIRVFGKSRNFASYLEALRSCGYEPQVDGECELFWPAEAEEHEKVG